MRNFKNSFLLILFSMVLFSCKKDLLPEGNLTSDNITPESRTAQNFADFRQAFESQKQNFRLDSSTALNPYRNAIDWSSCYGTTFNGKPTVIYNTKNSPFKYTQYYRNQIMISLNDGIYEISSIIYIADSAYYASKNYTPRLLNFTGKAVFHNSINEIYATYIFLDGDITATDIQARKKIECYDFGKSWWDRFLDWLERTFGGPGSGGGSGSGAGSWNWSGWSNGTWGDHSNHNGSETSGGSPGGAGGSYTNVPLCQTPSLFWNQFDPIVKKYYVNALSKVLDDLNIVACYDPYEDETQTCQVSYKDILCNANSSGCFSTPSLGYNDLYECLQALMSTVNPNPPNIDLTCQNYAQNFISQHNLHMNVFELALIVGGFGNICSSQSEFDTYTINVLNGYLLNGIQEFIVQYPILVPGNSGTYYTAQQFLDLGIIPFSCLFASDFDECVAEKLAENMTQCLQYDFVGCGESPVGICPESFKFVSTGNGYTCEVHTINFKYNGAYSNNMHIGTLCLQTSKKDANGTFLVPYEAAEAMSFAWDLAQSATAEAFALSNHTMTNQQYKDLFILNLYATMNLEFLNLNGTAISISNGSCIGNIPKSKPKYPKFLGGC